VFADVQVPDDFVLGNPHPSTTLCFSGNKLARAVAAENLVQQISGISFSQQRADFPMSSKFQGQNLAAFYVALAQAIRARGCMFDRGDVNVETYVNVLRSLVFHAHKIEQNKDIPDWLKPRKFEAVLWAADSENKIVIGTTPDGFTFHACEADPNTYRSKPPPPTTDCPPMMASVLVVPVDEFLKSTTGVEHYFMATLKAFSSIGLIITSNLGLAVASPIAQTATTLVNPMPLSQYQMNYSIDETVTEEIKMGNLHQRDVQGDPQASDQSFVVTRFFPYINYADLKQGLENDIENVLRPDFKKLGVLDRNPYDMSQVDSSMENLELKAYREILRERAEYFKEQAEKKAKKKP